MKLNIWLCVNRLLLMTRMAWRRRNVDHLFCRGVACCQCWRNVDSLWNPIARENRPKSSN